MRSVLLCVLVLANAGCLRKTEFRCETDTACGAGGQCEASGFCSFADGECASGRRYDSSAGPLSGQCTSGDDPTTDGGIDSMGTPDDGSIDSGVTGCPAGYVALSAVPGHLYKVLPNGANWMTQQAECKLTTSAAYLAVPDTIEELTALDMLAGASNYWIGISDIATEGTWINSRSACRRRSCRGNRPHPTTRREARARIASRRYRRRTRSTIGAAINRCPRSASALRSSGRR